MDWPALLEAQLVAPGKNCLTIHVQGQEFAKADIDKDGNIRYAGSSYDRPGKLVAAVLKEKADLLDKDKPPAANNPFSMVRYKGTSLNSIRRRHNRNPVCVRSR